MIKGFRFWVHLHRNQFWKPTGFGTNDTGDDIGFNTEVYSSSEVLKTHILRTLDILVLLFLSRVATAFVEALRKNSNCISRIFCFYLSNNHLMGVIYTLYKL